MVFCINIRDVMSGAKYKVSNHKRIAPALKLIYTMVQMSPDCTVARAVCVGTRSG